MDFSSKDTAIVITDPQNDFLSPEGVTWGVVGQSVTDNNTVENIEPIAVSAYIEAHPRSGAVPRTIQDQKSVSGSVRSSTSIQMLR